MTAVPGGVTQEHSSRPGRCRGGAGEWGPGSGGGGGGVLPGRYRAGDFHSGAPGPSTDNTTLNKDDFMARMRFPMTQRCGSAPNLSLFMPHCLACYCPVSSVCLLGGTEVNCAFRVVWNPDDFYWGGCM